VRTELAQLPFGYLLLVTYWTVFISELVGDKSIYTVSSLALRFRPPLVFVGLAFAFASKMLAAVLLGSFVVQLNSRWTDSVSACAFFASAMVIWFEEPESRASQPAADVSWSRAAMVCFSSLLFTEWGDPGQISAAALTLKSHAIFAVWLGGTLAMISKGLLAMGLGVGLRARLPQRTLRTLASASCCILGFLALGGIAFR
jgi:putative Ca2+/H+ antiporter (TMEM165/GDT1 family)